MPGEYMGESHATNAATGSGGRSAAKPWMVKRRGTNSPADEEVCRESPLYSTHAADDGPIVARK